jgi:signal transduction histidine kinase
MAEQWVLRLRDWRTRHPWLLDAALGVALAAGYLLVIAAGPDRAPGRTPTGTDLAAAALAVLLVASRRRWPLPVLAVATAAAAGFMAVGDQRPVLTATAVIAAYTVASLTDRTTAWLAGGAAAIVMVVASIGWSSHGWFKPENIGVFAWTGMAVALGDAMRSRRAYIAAVEERARRAEQSRDEEALRRVVEERLRIARELHDVVAHHIAVINVQAGVAAHVLREQPEQAEQALSHIRAAGRTVLAELATVLGVLRQPGDQPVSTEPTRGLGRLAELLDSLAAAGLRVEHRQTGQARALPAAVDLAAYRIIQEALTNAQKHGSGDTAQLRVGYLADGVTVDVTNPAAQPSPVDGTGHGIVGMRERATAVGGTLRTGPDGGQYGVHASLPTDPGEPA